MQPAGELGHDAECLETQAERIVQRILVERQDLAKGAQPGAVCRVQMDDVDGEHHIVVRQRIGSTGSRARARHPGGADVRVPLSPSDEIHQDRVFA